MFNKYKNKPAIFFALLFGAAQIFFMPLTAKAADNSVDTVDYDDSLNELKEQENTTDDIVSEYGVSAGNIYQHGDATIVDDAYLVESERKLDEAMQPFTKYGKAVYVTTSTGYESAREIEPVYDAYIGKGQDGFLLLIDMSSRQILIYSDGNVYNTINESRANTIADNIYRYASKGNYDDMTVEAFTEATNLMSGQKIAQPMRIVTSALLALSIALLLVFLIAQSATLIFNRQKIIFSMDRIKVFNVRKNFIRQERIYDPPSSSSSGGGGGSSGGGGHSGGGGGHSF